MAAFAGLTLASFWWPLPAPAETDAYFHLAIARDYTERPLEYRAQIFEGALAAHPADREPLFHLALAAFLKLGLKDLQAALVVAALGAAALAWILCWHTGSALAAICGVFGSHTVLYRLHMCRPHTIAIPLAVLGVALLVRGSRRSAAAVNLIYSLSYSVPVVILGAATLQAVMEKDWRSWVWILGSSAAGVLLHPHFPQNFWLLGYQGVAVISNATRGNPLGVRLPDELLPWPAAEFLAEFWLPLGLLLLALVLRREPPWLLVLLVLTCLAALRMRRLAEYWAPLTGLCVGSTLRWALPDGSLIRRGGLAVLVVLATVPMNTYGARKAVLEQRTGLYRGAGEWLRGNAPGDRVFNAEWDAYAELRYFSPGSLLAQGQDPVFVAGFDGNRYALMRQAVAGRLGAAELRQAFQCRFFLFRRTAMPLALESEPGVRRRFTDGRVVLLELPER